MEEYFKRLDYGKYKDTEELFIKMCKSSGLFIKENNDLWLPTINKLQELSGLDKNKFEDRCFSFYVSIEEDNFDPSIEVCGMCVVMKILNDKAWNPKTENWENWSY